MMSRQQKSLGVFGLPERARQTCPAGRVNAEVLSILEQGFV